MQNSSSERRFVREIVWESDRDADECHSCSQRFSLFIRRHHCRRCGLIFCADCSFHSINLPNLGFKEAVRVCSPCFRAELEKRNKSIPPRNGGNVGSFKERGEIKVPTQPRQGQIRSQTVTPRPEKLSENEELQKCKELILEQQKTIEILTKRMNQSRIEEQDLMDQMEETQPLERRTRSTSTPAQSRKAQMSSSLNQNVTPQSPETRYELAQSLKEGGIAPLTIPLPQYIHKPSHVQSTTSKVVVEFDETIVENIISMGYTRKVVLMCLVAMSESGLEINLESAIDFVVNFEKNVPEKVAFNKKKHVPQLMQIGESELRRQLSETEEKLKSLEEHLSKIQHSEVQKAEEIDELKMQINTLERVRREKDTQIEILTGGFGFGTYLKVHGGVDIMEESECIICMDNPKGYKTSCGCKVICPSCYKKLKKKECPNCGKKIK